MHGGYPLHYAAQMCGGGGRLGLAVLRTLLAHDVEVNVTDQDGRQPILWAASAGSADAILALVNAGASVEADDKDGLTALHCAASRGHTDCLETLISLCGAAVDVMDSNGCTALFYAVTLGHADATQLLLEHGAQPNRQDRKGRTPSHCGAAKGQLETLRILSTRGANMWARNVKGDYPLHEAVSSGRKGLVRWLLSQRPDAVNASNNDGRCPLHIAAINNNVEMCKIVLDHESLVNPVMRTSKGGLMTPLDAALYKGNRGCAKYLQLHGGVPANKLTSQSAALRGTLQRVDPHSDQVNTPDWGPNLTVPDLRGAQSLVQSPIELPGHKHLTVMDGSRTLEVRVEDEILHRRASESSTDDKVRRRRRKRRPRREGSEVETDSDRNSRRRRRRKKDHVETSDEDSEIERRRRRRRSKKGKGSEESESEETSKRKRKSSKSRRKRSVSSEHGQEDIKKEKAHKRDSDKSNEELNSNNEDLNEDKTSEQHSESRRLLKEEITTKEVTKSKKIVEHKEKSTSKPTVMKTSKTTREETKTEEQITTKTSEIISSPSEGKGDDVSTQESHDTPIQQVVTAIVHQENEDQTNQAEEREDNEHPIQVNDEDKDIYSETIDPKNEQVVDQADIQTEPPKEDEVNEGIDKTLSGILQEENTHDDRNKEVIEDERDGNADDGDLWDEETKEKMPEIKNNEIDIETLKIEDKEISQEDSNKDFLEEHQLDENKENENKPNLALEPDQKDNEINNEKVVKVHDSSHQDKEKLHESQLTNEKELENIKCEDHVINNEVNIDDNSESNVDKIEDIISDGPTHHRVDGLGKSILAEVLDGNEKFHHQNELHSEECNLGDSSETQVNDEENLNQDENKKGLIKILGRSEVDDKQLKGVVKVEKINSEVLKDRSKAKERERRRTSSFEIVSTARSLPDDDLDSETPRSRSRTGADSSQLQDSGFEPSPRRDTKKVSSRIPRACRRSQSHNRLEADSDDDRPSLSTISVTQAVQHSMRKYHLERRIFHELLELKRLQIRAGRSNEAVLVKRLVDDYRRAGLWIGLKQYEGVFTFRAFEKYLYDQLRILQSSDRRIIPRLKSTDDLEKLTKALRRTRAGNTLLDNVPLNPIYCTHGTHRCYHATHAYTGVPCAAYIAKINHHTMPKSSNEPSFLPRIDSGKQQMEGQAAELARCLRYVDPSRPVTLELSHGSDKQVISLPTEKLDKNKRYYVTFTIKGGDPKSTSKEKHQHAKSF